MPPVDHSPSHVKHNICKDDEISGYVIRDILNMRLTSKMEKTFFDYQEMQTIINKLCTK